MVASGRLWLLNMFEIQRQHFAIQIVALGLTNIRTTLCNVVLTRKSGARISKVARWIAHLYACVVRPWECCKTCRIWSCNVALPLHEHSVTLPTSIYTPCKQAIIQTRLDFQDRTMDAAVPIPPHRMVRMLNIRLQLQELQQQHIGLLALLIRRRQR